MASRDPGLGPLEAVLSLPGDPRPERPVKRTDRDPREDTVGRMLEEAMKWHEENVEDEQEKATKYYHGDISDDVPSTPGRSRAVSRDVHDTVHMILPALSKIFFGPDHAIEFEPFGPEDVEQARLITKYVDHVVVRKDNKGKLKFRNVHKDALIRKMGVVKVWWEENTEPIERTVHTGLSPEAIAFLQQDPNLIVKPFQEFEIGTEGTEMPEFGAEVSRINDRSRIRFEPLPNEEFFWDPDARSLEDAKLVAHVGERPANELIEMGFDPKQVKRHKGSSPVHTTDGLEGARRIDRGASTTFEDTQPAETRPVMVAEAYVQLPVEAVDSVESDNPSQVALHKVMAIGEGGSWEFLRDAETGEPSIEITDVRPFAIFGADPEPHEFIGNSIADNVSDIQRIKSQVMRGMLDSLSSHLDPAMEVGPGVNMADVLNSERGRVIRVQRPGMLREITTEFVGGDALGVLNYYDEVRTDRTGASRAAQGLDPDALQSSTAVAVNATIKSAQAQIEEIAWILADGYTQLFKLILKLLVQHQDRPRMVRLSNKFMEVNPKAWDADMDVRVNVGLGANRVEEKMAELLAIATKQEEHLQQGSPLTDIARLRNTYARINELQGLNPDEYWRTPQEIQQAAQQAAQNREPSSEERLQQIEMAKIAQDREEAMVRARVDIIEAQLRAQTQLSSEQIKAAMNAAKIALDREKAEVDVLTSGES